MLTEEIVAQRIKMLRLVRSYSQYYVAYKMNISQNTFSKIELGHVKLTLARLIDVANVLEIAPSDLMGTDMDFQYIMDRHALLTTSSIGSNNSFPAFDLAPVS